MAASRYETAQYTSEQFVESAGVILFKVSTRQICLVHQHKRNEWLLAKGRRGIGERRQDAAVREVTEETGYKCHLPLVKMKSRVTPEEEVADTHTPDVPRLFENATEPSMVTQRVLPHSQGIKLIWWFMGAIDEDAPLAAGEQMYNARLFGFDEALTTLTFSTDREIVERAIQIFRDTYGAS